jgi:dephospho-CoA kinase
MMKVAITGEMGAGKSFCAELFAKLGVPVFNFDKAVKEQQNINKKLRAEIIEAFGNVYIDDRLNIPVVRKLVFEDSDESRSNLKRLTKICSPYAQNAFDEFSEQNSKHPYTLAESAILFESGLNRSFDRIIYVTADAELRLKKAIERDGITEFEYKQRMKDQMDSEMKKKGSQFIITNDYTDNLLTQVESLHKRLVSLC